MAAPAATAPALTGRRGKVSYRLTADGKLRTCLFSIHETDLREALRSGCDDDEIETIVREAVWRKELKHHVSEPGFRQPPRSMSRIGG